MARELGPCGCPTRQMAQRYGFMRYSPSLGGWYFPDEPRRRLVYRDSWKIAVSDHTGEPYVYVTCPFCGGDLGS